MSGCACTTQNSAITVRWPMLGGFNITSSHQFSLCEWWGKEWQRLPEQPRIDVCSRSRLYMADLESGLHFLLRVELATHKALEGAKLKTFKDFVTISAKVGTSGL